MFSRPGAMGLALHPGLLALGIGDQTARNLLLAGSP